MKNLSAFPTYISLLDDNGNEHLKEDKPGMTLLDYFAAQAMQGELASQQDGETAHAEWMAERAYSVAEEMLTEREKHIK